ncbi:MAG: hypothetical protein ACFFAU_20955 [Candidatus Hodarchaeota archaeon]
MRPRRIVRKVSFLKMLLVLILILIWSHSTYCTTGDTGILPEHKPFAIAFLFSGDMVGNITACPWVFENETSEEIRGVNYGFRNYFSNNLSNEMAVYPQIKEVFMIEYTWTYNYFTYQYQNDPDNSWSYSLNVSTFDPYYCLVRLSVYENVTWDNQLAQKIETMLLGKWYVNQIKIIPDARVPQATPFGTEHFYVPMLLVLITMTLFRRKRTKDNEFCK